MNYLIAILYLPIGFIVWGIMCRLENEGFLPPNGGAKECGLMIVLSWPLFVVIAAIAASVIIFVIIVGLPLYALDKYLDLRRDKWPEIQFTKFCTFCKNGFKTWK
ncbi:MAG: hypothetical protein PHF35_01420 [Candidatus Moranbacteria bacterium]|nr:hypothetical protein [Candidatus Moranbacteria bacterium]